MIGFILLGFGIYYLVNKKREVERVKKEELNIQLNQTLPCDMYCDL